MTSEEGRGREAEGKKRENLAPWSFQKVGAYAYTHGLQAIIAVPVRRLRLLFFSEL